MAQRELLDQPAFLTESRDHHRFGRERVDQRIPQDRPHRIGEQLETVAGMKMKAGFWGHLPAPYHKRLDKRCPTK